MSPTNLEALTADELYFVNSVSRRGLSVYNNFTHRSKILIIGSKLRGKAQIEQTALRVMKKMQAQYPSAVAASTPLTMFVIY